MPHLFDGWALRPHAAEVATMIDNLMTFSNLYLHSIVEKERKKAEKDKKFQEKKAKQQQAAAAAPPPKTKEKKVVQPKATDAYEPKKVEDGRYQWWEERGYFKPEFAANGKEVKKAGKFVIPIPPPNVTGSLHMGHALTNALQDTMIRHARMKGETTAWVPGCDHAGISTQSVVEKMLWKTEHKTRHDLGREKLVSIIWDWKDTYHKSITNQLKRLGGSMDWSREAFTMDENLSLAVRETFIQLHDEGIIYRANRLVNWCTAMSTSLSNLEVDNKELDGRTLMSVPGYDKKIEFGVITYFKYPIKGSDKTIEVATTRPETMLGDTAVAVHPKDTRYTDLVGKLAIHPFIPDRKIIIIADEDVDMEFGTGAVKITPAHDPNDFNMGKKHGLEFINIFTDDGLLNENAGEFAGSKRFDARYQVIDALKKKGLYSKWENNPMKVPLCAKSKDVIEPLMKPQWWMKMESLAKPAIEAVRNGSIKITPESAEKMYFSWMENIQDWCLSRQLWWGHRAPAYFVRIEGKEGSQEDGNLWVCGQDEASARKKAEAKFPGKKFTLEWDEDVLDTWFSSGLWPFSTLGWPKKTSDMELLYPTTMLETGWDIMFFWVARMIMLGIKLTGKVPFTEVYCHSLIRDSEGRKMSKSLGNVVDPLDIIDGITLEELHTKLQNGNLDPKEISRAKDYQKSAFPKGITECGTDALRFSLVNYTTGGGDIAFDIKVIEAYRRFCNKIYQATNFAMKNLGPDFVPDATPFDNKPASLAEKWILHRLNTAAADVNTSIETRQFANAAGALYQYWLNQLCDTFIENTKSILAPTTAEAERASAKQTLYTALEGGLLLMHPIMPFITEHLWNDKLPRRKGDKTESIMIAAFPQADKRLEYADDAANYDFILEIAGGVRSLLSQYGFKEEGELIVQTYDESAYKTAFAEKTSIKSLGGKYAGSIEILPPSEKSLAPGGCAVFPVGAQAAVYLRIVGKVDIGKEKDKAQANLNDAKAKVEKIQKTMSAKGFEKATTSTQEKEKNNLKDAESEVKRFEEVLKDLERLGIEN
jgi:valyl-tRNA synthetase